MLHARQAVRQYTGQITEAQLTQILAAGNAAPVGLGQYDNYRLTVIQDTKVLRQLTGIYDAPTVIVVSATTASQLTAISAGAIAHNLELAAEDLGLGANYNMASLGSLPTGVVPSGFTPIFAVTLGQTTQTFAARQVSANRIRVNRV